MKKLFMIGLVILLTISMVGCAGSDQKAATDEKAKQEEQATNTAELKDGKYLVKYEVSSHGNFPVGVMEVEEGKITSFKYQEYLAESGEAKSQNNYGYEATPKVIAELNKQFRNKKDLEKLDYDVVSGATHTKSNFKKVVKDLLAKAKKGETYKPEYKDGTYTVKADKPSHGWLAEIKIVVKHGTIVGADYDEISVKKQEGAKVVFNEDGEPVKENGEYKTKPVTIEKGDEKSLDNYKYIESPKAMKAFEKQIINNNGVEEMKYDVVSGATHTKDRLVDFAKKALEKAVK